MPLSSIKLVPSSSVFRYVCAWSRLLSTEGDEVKRIRSCRSRLLERPTDCYCLDACGSRSDAAVLLLVDSSKEPVSITAFGDGFVFGMG